MPYTRLRYHIVTGTYDRDPLITADIEPELYSAMRTEARAHEGHLLQIGGVADHVHLVAALRPTMDVSTFVKYVKGGSSRLVRRQFGVAAFQWQAGYAAFTLAPHDLDGILAYVANQKRHHATDRLRSAYELPSGTD